MKPYIRMNIKLRKRVSSDFEKDPYKLMSNSVFRKTMRISINGLTSHLCKQMRRNNLGDWEPAQHAQASISLIKTSRWFRSTKASGPQPTCICRYKHPWSLQAPNVWLPLQSDEDSVWGPLPGPLHRLSPQGDPANMSLSWLRLPQGENVHPITFITFQQSSCN